MKSHVSRRSFLENLTITTSGIALLSSVSVINALTENDYAFRGYNPYAQTNSDMRQNLFGKHVKVSGTIYKKDGVTVLPDASIEVWHLSPNSTKYRHRAKLRTDNDGNYHFITDLPNKEKGKMPFINFKLSNASESYCSRLWIQEKAAFISSDHWNRNEPLGELLLPKKESNLAHDTIKFNLSI